MVGQTIPVSTSDLVVRLAVERNHNQAVLSVDGFKNIPMACETSSYLQTNHPYTILRKWQEIAQLFNFHQVPKMIRWIHQDPKAGFLKGSFKSQARQTFGVVV